MARFAFTLEDKNVLDETIRKIEVVGHKINEGGGKGKFMKAIAFDPPDRPLIKNKQYEAQWRKVGEEWQLINIEPYIETVLSEKSHQGKAFPEPQIETDISLAEGEIPDDLPTYEEAKTKVLRAIGLFLDVCYNDYHLGLGRKK